MYRHSVTIFIAVVCLLSCTTTSQTTSLVYKDYRIEKQSNVDSDLVKMLQPYSVTLNATMNKVIGFSNNNLNIKQPESAIGNFMADCIHLMAEKKFGKKVDAGFINRGGIRSYMPKGNITVGKVFEVMPFDNLVVLQDIKGNILQAFLDKTASDGGWPVSAGITMVIKDKKAVQVTINGKPLDEKATYVVANSDYIANGGDGCDMLRKIPKLDKGYLLRDAMIDYITEFTQKGQPLDPKIENRVTNASN